MSVLPRKMHGHIYMIYYISFHGVHKPFNFLSLEPCYIFRSYRNPIDGLRLYWGLQLGQRPLSLTLANSMVSLSSAGQRIFRGRSMEIPSYGRPPLVLKVTRDVRNNLNFGLSNISLPTNITDSPWDKTKKNLSSFSLENINLTIKFNKVKENQFSVKTNWNQSSKK